jgi:hypothetical protein
VTPPACVDTGNGVDIAGSVAYAGTHTGRLYVMATDNNHQPFAGTSLSTAGGSPFSYVIRGLPNTNGTVNVVAYLDTGNDTIPNVPSDPVATTQVSLSGSTMAGVNLNLADPPAAAPPTMPAPQVTPLPGSVVLQIRPPTDANGLALVDAFRIYWDTSPDPTSGRHLGMLTSSVSSFPTVGGLTNGITYYFTVAAVAAGVEGAASPSASAVPTALNPGTGHDVSGTLSYGCAGVTSSTSASVTLIGNNNGVFSLMSLTANPQPYVIHGVPDGVWGLISFIDMNANGVIDTGDETTGFEISNPFVVVSGAAATAPPIVVPGTNALASVKAFYDASSGYRLRFVVEQNRKLPVSASICGGPHIPTPSDLGMQRLTNSGRYYLDWNISSVPSVADLYGVNVAYSDGTTETLAAPITRVFTDAATLVSPPSTGAASVPTLTWSLPLSAPATYMQEIQVTPNGSGNTLWDYVTGPGVTSVVYNADGRASQATLTSGQSYQWSVDVTDQLGNRTSSARGTFQVQ